MLFPALGSVLRDLLSLDPFLFIVASGACVHVVSCTLSLYVFADARRPPCRVVLPYIVLGLSVIVAMRYPYWVAESIPVIFTLPVTTAVLYWTGEGRKQTWANFVALGIAVIGSTLSKMASVAMLAPLACTGLLPAYARMPRPLRGAALIGMLICVSYAAAILLHLGPRMLTLASLGPMSYAILSHHDVALTVAYPWLMRDSAAVVLACISFLFAPWVLASTISFGFVLFLASPFLFNITFVCATALFGLIVYENPDRLKKCTIPAFAGLLLALPAVLLTDPAGVATGVAWVVCIGGAVWIALSQVAREQANWRSSPMWHAAVGMGMVLLLGLTGVVRGHIILDSGWPPELTPQVRDIWLEVRARTPKDALIFTDQTGPEPTLLSGWNTYATIGERQIFVSDIYQTASLRSDPQKAMAVLQENEAILLGTTPPEQVKLRSTYSAFFAVVSRARTVPNHWVQVYANDAFVLYRL
jgi:hypothetical protein